MRRILIVVDMQNDFVDGALGTPEAQQIIPAVAKKIRSYPKENVIYTLDTHSEDYMNTQEGKNLPVVHCVRGTQGWNLNPVIAELSEGSERFEKPTFGSVLLGETLKTIAEKEELELELIGLCTDICVVSNALLLKAMMPEVPISVDARCCAGVTPESHAHALATMKACQIHVSGE
jgi:nicotinamidase-related amidase